jgi:hypothetical protein
MELRRGGPCPSPYLDGAGSAREGCTELTVCVRLPAVVAKVAIVLEGVELAPGAKVPKPPNRTALAANRTFPLSRELLWRKLSCSGGLDPVVSPDGEQRGGWG